MTEFDATQLRMLPLAERRHKLRIEDIAVTFDMPVPDITDRQAEQVRRCADRIRAARRAGSSVMLTFGAHLIKNGLAPMLIHLVEAGWLTHLATNGAGSIHDWEFAFLGQSTEDVRENTAKGQFGTWDETGRYIHLAVAVGGTLGLGYGASVGKLIAEDGFEVPSRDDLRSRIVAAAGDRASSSGNPKTGYGSATQVQLGAYADLLDLVERHNVASGRTDVSHGWKRYSIQASAFMHHVPLTVHPGIGYDIIYTHPMASGGAIGRGAMRDFLIYADGVSRLTGGVHMVIGSSVMGPMIFEKALSMANNAALNSGSRPVHDHYLAVVDIQDGGNWDWTAGEPPMDNPAYYLRFCKTFNRMGGTLDYVCMDNTAFLPALARELDRQ